MQWEKGVIVYHTGGRDRKVYFSPVNPFLYLEIPGLADDDFDFRIFFIKF